MENTPELNNHFIRIWTKILSHPANNSRAIFVTSALSGEGSTTIAIHLARTKAEVYSNKILLIEGNLKRPSIQDYFNLPDTVGLTEFIQRDIPLNETIQKSPIQNLHIMGPGLEKFEFPPFLEVSRIKRLLEQSKKEYDFILFDGPPVLEYPETAVIANQFDGTILIIQANKTIRSDVERAKKEITHLGGNIIGCILNRKKNYMSKRIYHKYFGTDV